MKRACRPLLVVAAWLLLATGPGLAGAEPVATTWTTPDRITQLKRADVDGDGVADVLLASGRTVYVYMAKSEEPGAAAFVQTLDDEASFADVTRANTPALQVLAARKRYVLDLADGTRRGEAALPDGVLDWRDRDSIAFLDLTHEQGMLLPTARGWTLHPFRGSPVTLELAPDRNVAAAGPFLEDTATATIALPDPVIANSAVEGEGSLALWAFSGDRLVTRDAKRELAYDVSFLPGEGDRRLVDLDRDFRPDVMHRQTTNRDGQYAFFVTPPVKSPDQAPPKLTPARTILRLSGFQLEPDLVDLDGDGHLDFVVTTIEIDAKNSLRALASGMVAAQTRAFLNRTGAGGKAVYDDTADASILSDVGVKLRFSYAGTIEVERSLTIVVDGDYDGDGRKDLLIRTGPSTVRIRRGRAAGVWEPEGVDLAIPPIGDHANIEAYAVDMDGNGADELLLVYRGEAPAPDRVVHLATGL